MYKNRVRNLIVHTAAPQDGSHADALGALYARYVDRRLSEAGLSPQQKLEALETIIALLRGGSGGT